MHMFEDCLRISTQSTLRFKADPLLRVNVNVYDSQDLRYFSKICCHPNVFAVWPFSFGIFSNFMWFVICTLKEATLRCPKACFTLMPHPFCALIVQFLQQRVQ